MSVITKTKIPFGEYVWNPFAGCSPCSPGCSHCYAARLASGRLKNRPLYKGLAKNGKWTGEVRIDENKIKVIGGKPKTILVGFMGDLFHPKVPFEFIDKVFAVSALCPQHTFLMLTKRVDRLKEYSEYINDDGQDTRTRIAIKLSNSHIAGYHYAYFDMKLLPLPNIHLGVTICNQKEADEKIPIPLQIPAAKRWISIEPMLGPIKFVEDRLFCQREPEEDSPVACIPCPCGKHWENGMLQGVRIGCFDYVVLGCESGPKRRLCKLERIIDIVRQCKAAGVGCFVKQVEINGKVSRNPDEWPQELRVQEIPK